MTIDNLIALDVETVGDLPEYALQPWRAVTGQARIRSIAVANGAHVDDSHVVLDPRVGDLRVILNAARLRNATVVCWNAPFDISWLIANGLYDDVCALRWLDGMLLRKHIFNEPNNTVRYGLKVAVAEEYPSDAGYEVGVDFDATTPEAVAALLHYNKLDAVFTWRLAQEYWSRLDRAQRRLCRIEGATIPMVAKSNVVGLLADATRVAALDKKLADDTKRLLDALQAQDPSVTPEVLASPKQLGQLIYGRWLLPMTRLTETNQPSTDKTALYTLSLSDPRAKLVRAYREALGNRTKYVENLGRSMVYNGDMRTRPQARMFGTYTGRLTYGSTQGKGKNELQIGVAIHQYPNPVKVSPDYRAQLVAPPGHVLVEFDFAGQEFRWMAVLSGDETMLQLCMPGEDAHSYMGAQASHGDYRQLIAAVHAGDKLAKRQRQLGKVGNLSLQYRTSANRLTEVAAVQHGLPITPGEAMRLWMVYRETYPGVPRYWDTQINIGVKERYAESVGGRRVAVTEWTTKHRWASESTCINFPVQGTGADQKYLALACVRPLLTQYGGHFAFDLHDGLFFYLPEDVAVEAAVAIKTLLSDLPYQRAWAVRLPIAFPVDCKLGPSWGELKELET